MTILLLVGVLAPSAGTGWDGLAYHLAVPKIYLQHHRILVLPWMSHSNFPFAMEMLYLLGLALQGQALAKLLNFSCGVLIALAVYCWGNKSIGKGAGLLGMAIFISIPLVFWEATVAYNELAFALFCLLSIWAWWKKEEGPASRWIILSGIFAGLALATKMLAGFLVVFMVLAILWRKIEQSADDLSVKQKTKPASKRPSEKADETPSNPQTGIARPIALALWLVPALLVAAPWYVKSYLWTGNPVYPFFYDIFGGR
ncbi:MAG: phospholipid carrier-dependent glycosyltransferase, partial [Armatimonadetes bacterium]|nr:phospholipid carrier-dependent glycosyltransferase [Armatimonadota bacterium]NIM23160.1 phospholipid carrier-dependent glycosyltransferase [Armatimonadota bacterium]NIM67028.1 phospholipid carrier-dependent glycosyltransferase [Armatimonadota bacterium]NIM75562.1 phospholipid carrier-dependent glycosyltransferase [Armatimonadota bacterium]NIN05217.1 phospholipid carrier-dependent glycosyltransferase [Armatimonadota bacterium]